jgi:hypothetical protein
MAIGVLIKRVISHGEDAKVLLPQQWLCLCYLLCISRLDTMENLEIYKTYMHFGQISDNGKISPDISCP